MASIDKRYLEEKNKIRGIKKYIERDFMIRQPIISVLGHVDHGKTTLLDRIRSSAIASKEAGGITQHIGASEVPIQVINEICGCLPKFDKNSLKIPGLLFIDTPGHEAFTNLRKRGGSIADLAILVVDVNDGVQPQTAEAIEILKDYKTPFIVAANKIDLITGWKNVESASITETLNGQEQHVRDNITTKIFELIGQISRYGLQSNLFDEITDFQKEIAIVPVCAQKGNGIAELLMLVAGLSQRYLEMKLNIDTDRPARGGILERKEIKGLGTVIDIILYDGTIHTNDTIAFATVQEEVRTAKIKALLKPKALGEMRDSQSEFAVVGSVSAAAGVRISAVGLDDALVGSTVIDSSEPDFINKIRAEITGVFKTEKSGPVLKADSIGGIEALSKIFENERIPISKKGIGNVNKRDVLDAFSMNAVNQAYATVLAFNVGVDGDARSNAESSGVKVIEKKIIYEIVDQYKEYMAETDKNKREAALGKMVMPAMIRTLQNSCFRISHPAIFGIEVMAGTIRPGCPMINENGETIGKIKGIQNDKSSLQEAKQGENVAISMDEPTFGRQVKENEELYTRVRTQDAYLLLGELSNLINNEERRVLEKIMEIRRRNREGNI